MRASEHLKFAWLRVGLCVGECERVHFNVDSLRVRDLCMQLVISTPHLRAGTVIFLRRLAQTWQVAEGVGGSQQRNSDTSQQRHRGSSKERAIVNNEIVMQVNSEIGEAAKSAP